MADNPTTELRVVITEDRFGNLEVQWQCVIKESGVSLQPRASHVIGQLQAAAIVVATKAYAGISGNINKALEKGNSKQRDKNHGSRS